MRSLSPLALALALLASCSSPGEEASNDEESAGKGSSAGKAGTAGKAGSAGKGGSDGKGGAGAAGQAGTAGAGAAGSAGAAGKGGSGGADKGGSAGAGPGGAGQSGAGGAGQAGSGQAGAGQGGGAVCGDKQCQAGESCQGCPQDCGACPPVCPCLEGVDNFCLYFPHDIAGCGMLVPGGYCDPDSDGDFKDADWVKGYDEYKAQCKPTCGDGKCASPSESAQSCPQDCPASCGDKQCQAGESCQSCPQDCGACQAACGDGNCTSGENCLTCPADCPKGSKVACSKLGAQDLAYTPEFDSLLKACPRVAKFIGGAGGPGKGFAPFAEMAAYKCACGGTTVLRVFGEAGSYPTGQDLWNARYTFLEKAEPWQKAAVDYLESDNECDAGHCWFIGSGGCPYCPSPEKMQEYAGFLSQWIDVASSHGYHPLIGNFSVGGPTGNFAACDGDGAVTFGKVVPAIQKAAQAGGGWAYHGYTTGWEQSSGSASALDRPFHYRQLIKCHEGQLASIPLLLTEAGHDVAGNPASDGYLQHGGWASLGPWLSWYQGELDKDAYVRGALLFTFGPPGQWDSFRLNGDVDKLKQLIGPATCPP